MACTGARAGVELRPDNRHGSETEAGRIPLQDGEADRQADTEGSDVPGVQAVQSREGQAAQGRQAPRVGAGGALTLRLPARSSARLLQHHSCRESPNSCCGYGAGTRKAPPALAGWGRPSFSVAWHTGGRGFRRPALLRRSGSRGAAGFLRRFLGLFHGLLGLGGGGARGIAGARGRGGRRGLRERQGHSGDRQSDRE